MSPEWMKSHRLTHQANLSPNRMAQLGVNEGLWTEQRTVDDNGSSSALFYVSVRECRWVEIDAVGTGARAKHLHTAGSSLGVQLKEMADDLVFWERICQPIRGENYAV